MGRTKDLRDIIPFTPGHFESIEEFASAIGWNLSTKEPSRSSVDSSHMWQKADYQPLVYDLVQSVYYSRRNWETIESHVDRVLSQYIEVDK